MYVRIIRTSFKDRHRRGFVWLRGRKRNINASSLLSPAAGSAILKSRHKDNPLGLFFLMEISNAAKHRPTS